MRSLLHSLVCRILPALLRSTLRCPWTRASRIWVRPAQARRWCPWTLGIHRHDGSTPFAGPARSGGKVQGDDVSSSSGTRLG